MGRRRTRHGARGRGGCWQRVGGRRAGCALAATSLKDDAEVAALLAELRGSSLYQRMDEVARQRLAAVIGRTIALLATQETPKKALERVLPIYRAVGRRSAYLSLLNENPAALERLLNLVAQSAWLAKQIAEQPMLLDELLDARAVRHAADARGARGPARAHAARRHARRRRGVARGNPRSSSARRSSGLQSRIGSARCR